MQFFVSKRVRIEMGDWKYYSITAHTKNEYPARHITQAQIDAGQTEPPPATMPEGVSEIKFNCELAEGETMPVGTELRVEPMTVGHGG